MSTTIRIPATLMGLAGGQSQIEVSAATVGDALLELVRLHPPLRRHLFSDEGRLRSFVNVYLNQEDARHLEGEATAVAPGDTITIVPSVAGG